MIRELLDSFWKRECGVWQCKAAHWSSYMAKRCLRKMSKYLDLMEKSRECQQKCLELYREGSLELAKFYRNVAEGYKQKARALKISEVDKSVCDSLIEVQRERRI